MAIGTSSGKTYETQFEEIMDQPVQMAAGKDLDKRTPEPLPILPPVHSIAPHNPNPPGGGYEIRPGERLSEVRDLNEVAPKYNWENNPPDFEADSWEDFIKHPRAKDWEEIREPKESKGPTKPGEPGPGEPGYKSRPIGWTVPKKPPLTS